jgi:hypothetical protein
MKDFIVFTTLILILNNIWNSTLNDGNIVIKDFLK